MADPSTLGGGTLCDWYKADTVTDAAVAVSAATASTAAGTGGGWPASNLNDGKYGDGSAGSWSATAAAPQWVKYQYGSARTIGSYRVHARATAAAQAPTAWTVEGSNDDSAWTTLDTRSSITWTAGQIRTFTISTPGSYLYYRMSMTATTSGNPSFAEWRLFLTSGQGTLIDGYSVIDQSANGHGFTTVVGAQGVLQTAGAPNGRAWGDYSGGGGGYQATGSTPVPTGDFTYFGLIKATSSAIQSLLGSVANASGGGAQLRLNAFKLEVDRDGIASVATSTLTFTSGAWTPFLVTYTKVTGSTKFRIGSSTQTISGTSGVTWTSPGTLRSLFSYGNGSSNFFSGGWVEIGRYSSVLSTADETELWDYLNGAPPAATVSVDAPIPTLTFSGIFAPAATVAVSAPAPTLAFSSLSAPAATVSVDASAPALTAGLIPTPAATVGIGAPAPTLAFTSLIVPTATVTVSAPAPDLSADTISIAAPAATVTVTASAPTVRVAGRIEPWDLDQSNTATLALDLPFSILQVEPPVADFPTEWVDAGFTEQPIWFQSHDMPTIVMDGDGPHYSPVDGDYTITESELGVPHLFVDGVDVTYLRDTPAQILNWSLVEPFGEETAVFAMPQILPFDQIGEGGTELGQIGYDRDVEIVIVESDGTRHSVWNGFVVSDEVNLTQTSMSNTYHCAGLLFGQLDRQENRVVNYRPPTDIGHVIPDTINNIVSPRFAPLARVDTGIMTTYRGAEGDTVADFVQAILAKAWTVDGRQWTINRTGPRTYGMVLKDNETIDYTLVTGTPGVEANLTRDANRGSNYILGRGVRPDGGAWRGMVYPDLMLGERPEFPNSGIGAYRRPLAWDPKVSDGTWQPDGLPQAEFNPKVMPKKIDVDLGTGITLEEGILEAQRILARQETTALFGSMSLMSDPPEGSRFLMPVGANVSYVNWRGGDYLTDFDPWLLRVSKIQVDLQSMQVGLTVDSQRADAMTLGSIIRRDREANVDPARRPGQVNRRSRQEPDELVAFDAECGQAIITSHTIQGGQWYVYPRAWSEAERLVEIRLHSTVSKFCWALFNDEVTPAQLHRWVGNPLAVAAPFDVNADEVDAMGYIEAWGELNDAAGYSPHAESDGGFTGDLIVTTAVEYHAVIPPWVWVAEYAPATTTISGYVKVAPV